MPLVRRNTRTYYYRSKRVDGRVTKEYVGLGEVALLAAERDAQRRAERAAEREAIDQHHAQVAAVCQRSVDLAAVLKVLASAVLVSAGYYQHDRGHWRRRGDS